MKTIEIMDDQDAARADLHRLSTALAAVTAERDRLAAAVRALLRWSGAPANVCTCHDCGKTWATVGRRTKKGG